MRSRRVALLVLAVTAVTIGAWAQFAPASFHASFPLDRGWVAADGPYNEHLIRDVGGLYLALAVITTAAAVRMRADLIRLTGAATLVFALPHLAYHALHLQQFGRADAVAIVLSLTLNALLPAWLVWSPTPRRHRTDPQVPESRDHLVARRRAVRTSGDHRS